ncbi:MAG: class B sortase, partial [Clostridia bacterium]|nr:class B sortase [Clostridia bacterium]
LSDFHTIIYGHRMYRDAMFNALKKYADEDFLKDHPSVYILTEAGVARYDAFAAYDADVKGSSYRLGLTEAKGQQALFNYCRNHSVIDSDIIPIAKNGDRLLTLSTCSADGGEKTRWVVHFVLGEFTAQ